MTFQDLEFKEHPNISLGFDTQAIVLFDNGYGASVVTGECAYGTYEIAVLKGRDPQNASICYTTPITDDVIGCDTQDEITKILQQVENLPKEEE
jgi:hypothetical protein